MRKSIYDKGPIEVGQEVDTAVKYRVFRPMHYAVTKNPPKNLCSEILITQPAGLASKCIKDAGNVLCHS
jgi:hypothetical protein